MDAQVLGHTRVPREGTRLKFDPLTVVVSLATQKVDALRPVTDIDGLNIDVNPVHNLGISPIRDVLRKSKPAEYKD